MEYENLRIAVIIPCHNEELTVAKVVTDLHLAMPSASIYVYDNNSTDRTAEIARQAGAKVRFESRPGKGNVVRRAFADIESDVYVMIDGDDTYEAAAAPRLVDTLVKGHYDHVLGVRTAVAAEESYRPGHGFGNRAFNELTTRLFGEPVTDMLSGFRAFSRRFVKSFPADSEEFEIETELTIHAGQLRVPQTEVPVAFQDRPEGSDSKLRTFRDGFKILGLLFHLLLHERPLLVCGSIGAVAMLTGVGTGIPVVIDFLHTGVVARFPTLIVATGLVAIGVGAVGIGMVLRGILKARAETRRLFYLQLPALGGSPKAH